MLWKDINELFDEDSIEITFFEYLRFFRLASDSTSAFSMCSAFSMWSALSGSVTFSLTSVTSTPKIAKWIWASHRESRELCYPNLPSATGSSAVVLLLFFFPILWRRESYKLYTLSGERCVHNVQYVTVVDNVLLMVRTMWSCVTARQWCSTTTMALSLQARELSKIMCRVT